MPMMRQGPLGQCRLQEQRWTKAMMKGSEQMKASIVFECEDIFGTYEKMKTNGVEFLGEPNQMEWGTFVQFKDEDGNVFLLKE